VALAVEGEYVRVVEPVVAEHLDPSTELEVRGDDDALSLVAVGDNR